MRISQNTAAFNAYRNLSVTNDQQAKSLEKLSSGFRINRAADDAAGLSISEGLRSQIGGLKQASRNAQDGISVVQTAEGALTETHSILQRMRDLSVQAANSGGLNSSALSNIQSEVVQLKSELDRISSTTQFNGKKLLDGTYTGAFQVGANVGETISLTLSTAMTQSGLAVAGVDVTTGTGPTAAYTTAAGATTASLTTIGGAVDYTTATNTVSLYQNLKGSITYQGKTLDLASVAGLSTTATATTGLAALNAAATATFGAGQLTFAGTATGLTATGVSPATTAGDTARIDQFQVKFAQATGATGAITALDTAIQTVSTQRANLGAIQNRFDHTINNLNVATENLSASESRIRDTDMAMEMTNFSKWQILQQAGTAMLAQANQVPQGVLQLLRG